MKSGVSLRGAGRGMTILHAEGESVSTLLSLSDCTDVEVSDLTLDGAGNPRVRQGINASNASRLRLGDLCIRDLDKGEGFGPHGILFAGQSPTGVGGVTNSEISDCVLSNIGVGASFGCGIRMSWGSSRNRVLRNRIENTGRGGIFTDNGSTDTVIQGNEVRGSGGEGLGIEVWGGGDRSVIEDNRLDHWLSIGGCDYCSVRRNVISDRSGRCAFCGIEAIGAWLILTDNTVDGGQKIGLSLSCGQVKNFAYWANNTVRDCNQWGSQFQGDQGGIAYQYLYRCVFEAMPIGQGPVWYPGDEGHGFRINGHTRCVTFDACVFRGNARSGLQLVGEGIDALTFRNCTVADNRGSAVAGGNPQIGMVWEDCVARGNADNTLPGKTCSARALPKVSIYGPSEVRVGEQANFGVQCAKDVAGVLWDFGEGLPVSALCPSHAFSGAGAHEIVVVVWGGDGTAVRETRHVMVTGRE